MGHRARLRRTALEAQRRARRRLGMKDWKAIGPKPSKRAKPHPAAASRAIHESHALDARLGSETLPSPCQRRHANRPPRAR